MWNDELVWGGKQHIERPHHNNGHPLLQESYLDGKLFLSGTESSTEFPGYMEGAVCSAIKVLDNILN